MFTIDPNRASANPVDMACRQAGSCRSQCDPLAVDFSRIVSHRGGKLASTFKSQGGDEACSRVSGTAFVCGLVEMRRYRDRHGELRLSGARFLALA